MELENIILSEVSQAPKTKNHMFSLICWLDLGQMQQCGWNWITWQGENTYGGYRKKKKTQNMKAFDVPTPEELIQKPWSNRGCHQKGIRNQCKDQLEMNQHGWKHMGTWKQCYKSFCIAILNSTSKNALSSLLCFSFFFNKISDKGRTGPAWNWAGVGGGKGQGGEMTQTMYAQWINE
jgi:hypothetical protein